MITELDQEPNKNLAALLGKELFVCASAAFCTNPVWLFEKTAGGPGYNKLKKGKN
jgi:hypothetical protein